MLRMNMTPMEDDLEILKKSEEKLDENSEESSSVALLIRACFLSFSSEVFLPEISRFH